MNKQLIKVAGVLVALTGLAVAAFWPETCRTVQSPGGFLTGSVCDPHTALRILAAGLGLAIGFGTFGLSDRRATSDRGTQ
jgi:hypothetical protein